MAAISTISGHARLGRLVTKRHFTSIQDKPCKTTQTSPSAQYWAVLQPEEALSVSGMLELRYSSTEPASQQYRAASEPASHTAQSFSLGFISSKSNWSISWFRLVWMQELIYTWASNSVETNQSSTYPCPPGCECIPWRCQFKNYIPAQKKLHYHFKAGVAKKFSFWLELSLGIQYGDLTTRIKYNSEQANHAKWKQLQLQQLRLHWGC